MNQPIDAIYDNGVFKPLLPLALPDQVRVKLTIEAPESASQEPQSQPDDSQSDVLARQKAALEKLRREIDQIPQHRNNDGWSVRQHDEILYGSHK